MFVDEFSKITGLPISETLADYKLINMAGKAIYVQNYVKLLTYLPERVEFKIKNNSIIIEGEHLVIAQLSPKDALIKGNIFKSYLLREVRHENK